MQRKVSLFRDGRDQAVSIPREFEMPGTEAVMRREGDRPIIESTGRPTLIGLLDGLPPLDPTDRLDPIERPAAESADP